MTDYDEGTGPAREESRTLNIQGHIETLVRDRPAADETRGYNEANELETRDEPGGGSPDWTLTWDATGNLTNDAEDFEYVYDVFGRLVRVKETGTSTVVANYVYNGLGMKIVQQEDTNGDGELTTDAWYHYVVDPQGRTIAVYRLSDAQPKEEFVFHAAGSGEVLLRDKDADNHWKQASDGLDRRDYFLADYEGSVVAIVDDLVERVGYSASGVPFGMPCGDVDGDGITNSTDVSLIHTAISNPYDELYDLDWDGKVDTSDKTIASGYSGTTLGEGVLSGIGSRVGWRGIEWEEEAGLSGRVSVATTLISLSSVGIITEAVTLVSPCQTCTPRLLQPTEGDYDSENVKYIEGGGTNSNADVGKWLVGINNIYVSVFSTGFALHAHAAVGRVRAWREDTQRHSLRRGSPGYNSVDPFAQYEVVCVWTANFRTSSNGCEFVSLELTGGKTRAFAVRGGAPIFTRLDTNATVVPSDISIVDVQNTVRANSAFGPWIRQEYEHLRYQCVPSSEGEVIDQ